jgi:hypothetical protein
VDHSFKAGSACQSSTNKGLTITATIEEESSCARAYPQSAPTHKRNFVHNLLPVMEQDGELIQSDSIYIHSCLHSPKHLADVIKKTRAVHPSHTFL